jgi:TonB-dependent starch-binding outer membrane protein SusC
VSLLWHFCVRPNCKYCYMNKILLFVLLIAGPLTVLAQTRTIRGKVQDNTGAPMPGANVLVKGSTNGTQTSADGNFSLNVEGTGRVTLVISSTGYRTREIITDGSSAVSAIMETQVSNLEDVVVVGYQTVKRRDLTGSVSSVNSRQLKDIPINSAAQALTGRLAGVQITGAEGSPNADAIIRVRGGGSITQDNSPLFIIDGIQVENALSVISPQDIESVDVLKDASATAIYGARGANGVMIITTKSGRNRKPTITYSGMVGMSKLANKLDVMNPYEFVKYQYEASRGSTTSEGTFLDTYGTFQDIELYRSVPFVDWQEQMFGRDAWQQTHNVSLSGGNDNTTYNLSLTSNKQDGIQLSSDFDRKLVSFKFDNKVNKSLKVGFTTRFNNTLVNGAGTSDPGSSSNNRLRHVVKYRPFLSGGQDLYDYDEAYADLTNSNSLQLVNPLLYNTAEYRRNINNVLNLTAYADLAITKFLSFKSTIGVDFNNMRQTAVDDSITGNSKQNGNGLPLAFIGTSERLTINNSNVLTFSNASLGGSFHEKNSITVLVGHEIYQARNKGENQFARYFPTGISPKKALGNMNLGTQYINPGRLPSYQNENHLVSGFGRINYSYDDKYLLTLSARSDGSSKFAPGNKWSFFPSGSVAWRVSKEKFMDGVSSVINDLKLRASYGEAGNNRISDFLYLSQFAANTQYWLAEQMVTGFSSPDLANSLLVWEKTISKNIGVDVSLLNNRLQLSVDVYNNTTKDLLVAVPIPTETGYTTQIQNVGSTENKGVEIQLNATPVSTKNFAWNATFNISYNKNKITSLGTYQDSYLQSSGWGVGNTPADFIVKVGQPVGTIRGFITDGYYQLSDFNYNASTGTYTLKAGQPNNNAVTSLPPYPGRLKFKNLTGDSVITDADRTFLGVAQPKFFGGLNNQFSYKNFDLSVFVNFQIGNDVVNANRLEFTNGYTVNSNQLAEMNGRWRNVNDQGVVITDPVELAKLNANATIWTPSTSSNAFQLHSWAVEDGSFLRVNNITLGYTVSPSLTKRVKIQSLRFYATANNLAVITNYSGYDPEVSTRRSTPVTPGVDYAAYPRSRSYIVGVNLTF